MSSFTARKLREVRESLRNGHDLKLLIYFQESKIREKLLPNEGTMMKVFRVLGALLATTCQIMLDASVKFL